MKRRVNKVGQNTLTVSLPSSWANEAKIKKGDELEVSSNNDSITFSRNEHKKEKKEITLNIDDYDYMQLTKYLSILYKSNYTRIILTYSNNEISDYKKNTKMPVKSMIKKVTDRLIGAEIISQSSTKTEIECLASEENPDLKKIEHRIYFLMKETISEMLNSTLGDFSKFHETSYDHHDNITKFITYFLRELYSSSLGENEKKNLYAIYSHIDTLVDQIRHISEKIHKYGCSPKLKGYLEKIFNIFFDEYKCMLNKELPLGVIKQRYQLKEKMEKEKFTASEMRIIAEAVFFLEFINMPFEYILIARTEEKKE